MKRIDRKFNLLIAMIFVLGLSPGIMAQTYWREPIPHWPMKPQSGFQFLGLTEEQNDQIKQIHLDHMKDVQPLKDEVRINRAKIDALLKKDEPDMKQIVSLVEANGKLLTQIELKSIEQKINIRSLLTEEQKIIFDAQTERMGKYSTMVHRHRQGMNQHRNRF